MPGFLGGSGASSSGTGGEIRFPKEFIDPVTKLRVSNPENLIDTDFEYGLQPTKWETVELINNTPSFFSKSGDTTIPGIVSISTNAGTREITVSTALDHGLAIGIPINVQGTKSVTADGSYIINSIPDTTTFTYLAKSVESNTLAIEDLYTSIITGEFFQGSQLRIADADGIVTDAGDPDPDPISTLTVTTESPHGFGVNTPFYFLNLNSTISQEFEAANTASKSFDASNSATAQTFDGSNTLSTLNIDWSNSATVGGTVSNVTNVNTTANTISVSHTSENFSGLALGTPLYYDVQASLGYFLDNPRGVVFLNSIDSLDVNSSTFSVSTVPDGDDVNLQSNLTGTFQVANQARTFAGNNTNAATETVIDIVRDAVIEFEGAALPDDTSGLLTDQTLGGNGNCTVDSYSGSLITVITDPGEGLDLYQGAMVLYSSSEGPTGAAAGLANNTTYFIDSFFSTGTDEYAFTVKAFPTDNDPISVSGGTGTQTFSRIGISIDKDIVHIKNSQFNEKDMLEYEFPASGAFEADEEKVFYFVSTVYDAHNYELNPEAESFIAATGGSVIQTIQDAAGRNYTVHRFTSDGTFTLNVTDAGTFGQDLKFTVAGSGSSFGGATSEGTREAAVESITVVVDNGGRVDVAYPQDGGTNDIAFATINPVPIEATGGSISDVNIGGTDYRVHTFISTGTSTFTVSSLGNVEDAEVEFLAVGGGGAGGFNGGGGGGGGSVILAETEVSVQNYTITVGAGGAKRNSNDGYNNSASRGGQGGSSLMFGVTATGGGGGGAYETITGGPGGNGGGGGDNVAAGGAGTAPTLPAGVTGTVYAGNNGAPGQGNLGRHLGGGGGGAGGPSTTRNGGPGVPISILGPTYYFGGGGGAGAWAQTPGVGGIGGAGGGGRNDSTGGAGGGSALNPGANGQNGRDRSDSGGNAGANTGGGGGGATFYGRNGVRAGNGGSGIVIIRYPLEPVAEGENP